MLKDHAQGKVLECYQDDMLKFFFSQETVELLLRVPAEQRQNVMAEFAGRTTVSTGLGEMRLQLTPISRYELLDVILRENGW